MVYGGASKKNGYILSNYVNILSFKQLNMFLTLTLGGSLSFTKIVYGTEGHYIGFYILLEPQVINERQRGIFNY